MGFLTPHVTLNEPWTFLAAPGRAFASTDCSGKWCIFRAPETVDAAWIQIVVLVSTGALVAAKVSTKQSATAYGRHVICIYTADWQDAAEVQRVREVLRKAGFGERLGYKRDADTVRGVEQFVYEQ